MILLDIITDSTGN